MNRIDVHRLRETAFVQQAGFDKIMDGIATMAGSAQAFFSCSADLGCWASDAVSITSSNGSYNHSHTLHLLVNNTRGR
jgi:hypothetical protein